MKCFWLLLSLLLASCVDTGPWVYHKDGSYGPWWWQSTIKTVKDPLHYDSSVWLHGPSDSAPESLKPYYDPELTRALNQ